MHITERQEYLLKISLERRHFDLLLEMTVILVMAFISLKQERDMLNGGPEGNILAHKLQ